MIALKEVTPIVEILNYDDNQVSWIVEQDENKVRVSRYRHTEERGLEAEFFIKEMTPDSLIESLIRKQIVSVDDDLMFALEEDFENFIFSRAIN